ncbi:MAG: dTMP kinase [Verrucomicrobiota bacterium]
MSSSADTNDLPKFITFEGSEGCGKSTQLQLTKQWLEEKGETVHCFREPGGTPLGESLRNLLKHDQAGENMDPLSEVLLFIASRTELIRKQIRPALTNGHWVLCDRFLDSTTIYQGIARGIGKEVTSQLNQIAVGDTLPTLTFFLALEPSIALERARARNPSVHDRMENEPADFYQAVHEGYRQLLLEHPQRIKEIDATPSPDKVFHLIQKEILNAFPCL